PSWSSAVAERWAACRCCRDSMRARSRRRLTKGSTGAISRRPMSADSKAIWHQFTQHGLGVPEIKVAGAEGSYLYTDDGRAIIDAISSWWVNLHGHGHPHIAR